MLPCSPSSGIGVHPVGRRSMLSLISPGPSLTTMAPQAQKPKLKGFELPTEDYDEGPSSARRGSFG